MPLGSRKRNDAMKVQMERSDSMPLPEDRVINRDFSEDIQQQFAKLTGDRNPMHMDAVAARRTQPGAPVVHGIHTLLWALDRMAAEIPGFKRIRKIKTYFFKWIYVNSTANLVIVSSSETEIKARIIVDEIVTASITVTLGTSALKYEAPRSSNRPQQTIPVAARELQFSDMASQSGYIDPLARPEEIAQLFPQLSHILHPQRVAALATLSPLVGMVCPGLYSIFSGLNIEFEAEQHGDSAIDYRVKSIDERIRMVNLEIRGSGISGIVETFVRLPPAIQMSMDTVSAHVEANEFSGTHALIVGGSRGLGELTAKVIAAGGGRVTITYAIGSKEAEGVAREIQQSGGVCDVIAYDALQPAVPQLQKLSSPVTHAYYYATGQIFRTKRGIFSKAFHREFNNFYVEGFFDLCESLAASTTSGISVFYPSSIAVADRPSDMTEYAMAKTAGEVLCEDINRFMKGVRVVLHRLPRLPTDQTLSVIPVKCSDPLEIILPIIREVQNIRAKNENQT